MITVQIYYNNLIFAISFLILMASIFHNASITIKNFHFHYFCLYNQMPLRGITLLKKLTRIEDINYHKKYHFHYFHFHYFNFYNQMPLRSITLLKNLTRNHSWWTVRTYSSNILHENRQNFWLFITAVVLDDTGMTQVLKQLDFTLQRLHFLSRKQTKLCLKLKTCTRTLIFSSSLLNTISSDIDMVATHNLSS